MNNLEIAQTIANEIDNHTQEEIDMMMKITCKTHDIELAWLFRAVSNLYGKMSKREVVKVSDQVSYE